MAGGLTPQRVERMADEGLLAQLGVPSSGLAGMLVETLPTGSRLVVRWRDASGREGNAATAGAAHLMDRSARLLAGEAITAASGEILETWTADDETRIAIAAALAEALPAASQQAWLALVRRTVSATLASIRAQARIESLQKSERLQQALYEIADLAGSGLEMEDMLRRIHSVVGRLMYARNFYIVLYDDAARTLRFLYFADQIDAFKSEPDRAIPIGDMPSSLTVGLLLHGEPLRGPSEEIRDKLGIVRDPEHGHTRAAVSGGNRRHDLQDTESHQMTFRLADRRPWAASSTVSSRSRKVR